MANFNRVILAGNLTRDPQLRYLPNNTAVCEFGLAINRRWRDQDGNQRDDTCFVDVAAFGRQGETINQYMTKGRPILVEGRLKFDSWQAQDGSKRSRLSVVAENFQFLGGRDSAGGAGASGERPGGGAAGAPANRAPGRSGAPGGREAHPEDRAPDDAPPPPSGDDIPF